MYFLPPTHDSMRVGNNNISGTQPYLEALFPVSLSLKPHINAVR